MDSHDTLAQEQHTGRIAIIGMACRLPGIDDVEALWRFLLEGGDSARPVDEATLRAHGVSEDDIADPAYVRSTRSLPGTGEFDAAFFGITPRAASHMDPQQRIFLECCQEAMESAGYPPDKEGQQVGVFAGSATSTYMLHHILPGRTGTALNDALLEHAHGNDKDYLTTQVSYRLNLLGPSISINTACSSALVAVVEACKSLAGFDCDMALAGGIRIEVPSDIGYRYRKGGILSADGRCRPFDATADGTAFADGAGVVMLKRFEDAVADGDTIHATIEGYAANNDGAAKAGYTAPGPRGQEQVLREALAFAGVSPADIGYLEAHGTGTVVGDPVEFAALNKVFPSPTSGRPYCAVGSAKANFGHLNTAAGIVGLLKAVLTVQRGVIPRQIHVTQENADLRLPGSAFHIPRENMPWTTEHRGRLAGISSFGIGGTNAHVVLRGHAPATSPVAPSATGAVLLPLSARSQSALSLQAARLATHLREHPSQSLRDIAHTLQHGRQHFAFRAAWVCATREEAIEALEAGVGDSAPVPVSTRPVFLFPGQGSQSIGMARCLYMTEPAFRDDVDRGLAALAGMPVATLVRDALLGRECARIDDTEVAQPALFILCHALARWCMACGIVPDAMIGHSLGEFVAATLAGVMSSEDAVRLVATRGRLMQAQPRGAMLAVGASVDELAGELDDLAVAAVNGARSIVLSGSLEAIERLERALHLRDVPVSRLRTSHAFHGPSMQGAVDHWREALRQVRMSAPRMRYVSNVTGDWIDAGQAMDPDYWVAHLLGTVRFADGISTVTAGDPAVFIEVGPGRALAQLVRRITGTAIPVVGLMDMPVIQDDGWLGAARGRLWCAGIAMPWPGGGRAKRVPLPTYPFERQRYWLEPEASESPASVRRPVDDWFHAMSWKGLPRSCASVDRPPRTLVFGASDGETVTVLRDAGHDLRHARSAAAAEACLSGGWKPERIVVSWQAEGMAGELALEQLLGVAQWLGTRPVAEGARLDVLTVRGAALHAGEAVEPAAAMLAGAARVLGDERHVVQVASVDIDGTASSWRAFAVGTPDGHQRLALRHGHWWIETCERIAMPDASEEVVRSDATYLVTGGWGGIGRHLITHLAQTQGVRIAIFGRRESSTSNDAFICELEARGARVMALAVDLADETAVRRGIEAVQAQLGPIDGVFHLAGVAAEGVLDDKDVESLRRTLVPKLAGTRHLRAALSGTPPSFIVLFSSLSAIVGGVKQFDYAAANAYLDAYAQSAQASDTATRWISIGWDAWRAGMAEQVEVPAHLIALKAQALSLAIAPEEGMIALRRVLSSRDLAHVVVSTRDVASRRVAARPAMAATATLPSSRQVTSERPATSAPYAAPRTPTEILLATLWGEALGYAKVGRRDNFFELGGDSLAATRVVASINARLGVDLGVRDFLESRHIEDLAGLVDTVSPTAAAVDPATEDEQVW